MDEEKKVLNRRVKRLLGYTIMFFPLICGGIVLTYLVLPMKELHRQILILVLFTIFIMFFTNIFFSFVHKANMSTGVGASVDDYEEKKSLNRQGKKTLIYMACFWFPVFMGIMLIYLSSEFDLDSMSLLTLILGVMLFTNGFIAFVNKVKTLEERIENLEKKNVAEENDF